MTISGPPRSRRSKAMTRLWNPPGPSVGDAALVRTRFLRLAATAVLCRMAECSQVHADVLGVGDAEVGAERQGVLPVLAGQAVLACRLALASETGVGAGLLVPVTGLDGQGERGGVLGARLPGLSRGVQRFPDAVERLGLAVPVARLAEDGESLPQIVGRLLVAALPQVNHAKVSQGVALADAVARLAEGGEGLTQSVGRLLVMALAQVDDAEIGQSVSLAEAMAGLAVEDEGLPVALGSLPVAALPPADEAEITQRVGFANAVACFAVAGERLPVAFGGLLVAALPPVDEPEVGQRAGLTAPVTGLAEERECLPVVFGGLLVAALSHVNDAKIGQGVARGGAVTRLAGGVPGVGVDAQRVGEVSTGIEVTEQGGSQPDGVSGPAVGGGVCADGCQVWSFGIQPGKCGGRVGHRWGGRVIWGDAGPLTPFGRAPSVPGARRGGQIVVEEAGQRRPPV